MGKRNKDVKNVGAVLGVASIVSTGIGAVGLATSATVTAAEGAVFIAGMTSDALTIASWAAGV